MHLHELVNGRPIEVASSCTDDLRRLAVKQVERKRKFREHAVGAGVLSLVLCLIWGISEYHNAGGWPSSLTSFSQSSGQPGVWNIWVIYPLVALGLAVTLDACFTYLRKPITENEVRREMDRLL
jgi:hypothetical protein